MIMIQQVKSRARPHTSQPWAVLIAVSVCANMALHRFSGVWCWLACAGALCADLRRQGHTLAGMDGSRCTRTCAGTVPH